MMKYSPSTNGFYCEAVHGADMPTDVIDISPDEHASLINGPAAGLTVVADSMGRPVLQGAPAPTHKELASSARRQRDALLAATDWTQIADVPGGTAARWRPYRKALREVPDQAGFPAEIDWPVAPG